MSELNWNKEFALEQAADDQELLQELLDIFKDSLQSDIAIMEQGLAEKSAEQVCGAAHSIKGAAASLGMQGLNDVAFVIEQDSREGGLTVANENVDVLKNLLSELMKL